MHARPGLEALLILVCAVVGETALGEDLLDMRQLGQRGAVLEAAPERFRVIQSLAKFNDDGLDDIGIVSMSEPGPASRPGRMAIVYGRRDLVGPHLAVSEADPGGREQHGEPAKAGCNGKEAR
jgi:hypothetical protein